MEQQKYERSLDFYYIIIIIYTYCSILFRFVFFHHVLNAFVDLLMTHTRAPAPKSLSLRIAANERKNRIKRNTEHTPTHTASSNSPTIPA